MAVETVPGKALLADALVRAIRVLAGGVGVAMVQVQGALVVVGAARVLLLLLVGDTAGLDGEPVVAEAPE